MTDILTNEGIPFLRDAFCLYFLIGLLFASLISFKS